MLPFAPYILPITVFAAVGSGLMAGLLFAFSNFVMKALTRLPPGQGMAAMQLINVAIVNPLFLLVFLGTAVLCVALALYAVRQDRSTTVVLLLVGSVLYLVGTVGVTMVFNVPLNNALAGSKAAVSIPSDVWPSYVKAWLLWNHLRTFLSFAAAVSLTFAATQVHRIIH
jgi:uncharacterized membrane protein